MKNLFTRIAVLALVCTLSFTAFAKEKRKSVTFSNDVNVNGTVVKKGTYKVVYDDTTNEVSIFNDNKELLVKSPAKFVPQDKENNRTFLATKDQDNARVLNAIGLEGEKQMIFIEQTGNELAKPQ